MKIECKVSVGVGVPQTFRLMLQAFLNMVL
jgi:hypothetical protein